MLATHACCWRAALLGSWLLDKNVSSVMHSKMSTYRVDFIFYWSTALQLLFWTASHHILLCACHVLLVATKPFENTSAAALAERGRARLDPVGVFCVAAGTPVTQPAPLTPLRMTGTKWRRTRRPTLSRQDQGEQPMYGTLGGAVGPQLAPQTGPGLPAKRPREGCGSAARLLQAQSARLSSKSPPAPVVHWAERRRSSCAPQLARRGDSAGPRNPPGFDPQQHLAFGCPRRVPTGRTSHAGPVHPSL